MLLGDGSGQVYIYFDVYYTLLRNIASMQFVVEILDASDWRLDCMVIVCSFEEFVFYSVA